MNKPASRTTPDLLAEMATRYPDREYVVDGDTRLTYREFRGLSRAHARGLYALGLRRGSHMAILMDNRHEWLVAYFAAMSIGVQVVALNTWATAPELAYQLRHADVELLVTEETIRAKPLDDMLADIALADPDVRCVGKVVTVDGAASERRIPFASLPDMGRGVTDDDLAANAPVADDVACILYTSGSTSMPKGVPLLHRGLIDNMWSIGERMHLTQDDRLWLAVSLFWSFSCVNALFTVTTHGGTVILQYQFDAGDALRLIERERCSVFYGVPAMALALTVHPDRKSRNLRSLRTGATIGTPEQIQRIVDLGVTEICNVYGLTEAYGNSAVIDCKDPLERRLHCSGPALVGTEIRVVDPESNRPLPAGGMGEIVIRGNVTPGYLNDPERTAEAIDAEGWLHSGDLGVLDGDGYVTFHGRLKELVKTGGINVAPAEVEKVLVRHGSVDQAWVTGIPDPRLDEAVAAVIVPKAGVAPSADELIAFCRQSLAAYKVPRHYRFVAVADLPLTSTGKLQKNRLAAFFSET
jgi:fatty-acyl-CoA synthase